MDDPYAWKEGYLDVDGVRTHYLEAGVGETLVLIHGGLVWCCAELTYGAVLGPLSRNLRVIAVDTIGYGLTEGPGSADGRASSQGDFLIRFLRRLGAKCHLGGNSHGGWLVQYIAHEAPELVKRLILINSLNGTSPIPADYPVPLEPETCPSEQQVRDALLAFYFDERVVTTARVKRTHAYTIRNHELARARQGTLGSTAREWNRNLMYRGKHISEYAGALRMPVLLTWSRENRGASPSDALAFYIRLADAEMHVFANAGHHVMTEHPERWSAVVADFLLSSRRAS